MLTDFTGPFYTLLVEETFESLGAMEDAVRAESRLPAWGEFLPRFAALVETGHRELLRIVADTAPP